MTDKQIAILNAALELFARDGYNATSTRKVAKYAGVSEGLIFRHFENKEGLLKAILVAGQERATKLFAEIVADPDPFNVLRRTVEMVSYIATNPEESNFWKLMYKIKWETEADNSIKMEPLRLALIRAFTAFGEPDPKAEADLMLTILDGMAMRHYLNPQYDIHDAVDYLKIKYRT